MSQKSAKWCIKDTLLKGTVYTDQTSDAIVQCVPSANCIQSSHPYKPFKTYGYNPGKLQSQPERILLVHYKVQKATLGRQKFPMGR